MAWLVTLLLSQIALINDLMTIRHAYGGDQTQRPEQKPRNSPEVAFASLLGGNGFLEAGADQMKISTNSKYLSSTENAQHTRLDSQRLQHC